MLKILSHFSVHLVYIFGILLNQENKITQLAISRFTNKSTRKIRNILRNNIDFDRLFLDVIHILNINLKNGYFVIDETVYSKPYSKDLKFISKLFSPANKSYTKGYKIVLLCWSNNEITLPISFKIWHKYLGKTQIELALDLIRYAQKLTDHKNLRFKFDAFYNKKLILRYLQINRISFVTRLEKSRNVLMKTQLIQLKSISFNRKVLEVFLPGVGRVWITKYKRKYYCSNVRPDYQKQLYQWYAERWMIECVFRFVKSELGFEDCQSVESIQNYNHVGYCFLVYALLVAMFPRVNTYEAKRRFYSSFVQTEVKIVPLVLQLCA